MELVWNVLHSTLWNIRSIVWNMDFHNVELVWNSEFHKNEKGSEMHMYPRSWEHHVPELGRVVPGCSYRYDTYTASGVERIDHL